jgi:hypothetical protein
VDLEKYLTTKNVAIFGTITFHMVVFAIFTHLTLDVDYERESAELLINFTEDVEELKTEEVEIPEVEESKVNILEEFSEPVTNQASNRASSEEVEELRNSMKSLNEARDNQEDLFSDEAVKREIKVEDVESENLGSNEEVKKETSYTGRSTINYSLENRYSVKLQNPIYTCINGGLIVVDIEVDKNGRVIDASYNKRKSNTSDECLIETSLKYAKMSRFNQKLEAPSKQKGWISYRFPKN